MRLEKGVKQPDIAAYAVVTQLQNITLPKLQRLIRAQLAEGELAYLSPAANSCQTNPIYQIRK